MKKATETNIPHIFNISGLRFWVLFSAAAVNTGSKIQVERVNPRTGPSRKWNQA